MSEWVFKKVEPSYDDFFFHVCMGSVWQRRRRGVSCKQYPSSSKRLGIIYESVYFSPLHRCNIKNGYKSSLTMSSIEVLNT